MRLSLTREFAHQFAEDWIAVWNSHDLEAILSHYTDDFEMSSPLIVQANRSAERRGRRHQLRHPAQKRLDAVKLVKNGKLAPLGHPYSNHMPLVPGRTFALTIPSEPSHGPLKWPRWLRHGLHG